MPVTLIAGTATLAALVTYGRAWPHTARAGWWLTFVATAAGLGLWWVKEARHLQRGGVSAAMAYRRAARPLWPLAVCLPIALLLYASEPLHHLFAMRPRVRVLAGAALLASLYGVRVAAAPASNTRTASAVRDRLRADGRLAVPAALLVVGGLQAVTYLTVAVDDLGRYWSIADTLRAGGSYPLWEATEGTAQGGHSGVWTDLPGYPLTLIASFALAGHTYAVAHLPLVLANVLLPILVFGAVQASTGRALRSYLAAVGTVTFPFFQVYTLGAAEPDALFVMLLVLLTYLTARAGQSSARRSCSSVWGAAAGLTAASVALTRPEGPVYAALVPAGLVAGWLRQRRWRASTAFIAAAAIPVCTFAALMWVPTGRIWPQAPRELALANVGANLSLATAEAWPFYARQLLLSPGALALAGLAVLATAAVGAARLWRRHSTLAGVPAALVVHTALVLLLDPYSLRTADVTELYRHTSYGTPLLALLVAIGFEYPAALAARLAPTARRALGGAVMVAVVLAISVWFYLLATPEEIYARPGQGSLLRQDIYVLWQDLWAHPFPLPELRAGVELPRLRDELTAFYRPYDLHGIDRGFAYQLAAWLGFVAGLPFVLADRGRGPVVGGPRVPGR